MGVLKTTLMYFFRDWNDCKECKIIAIGNYDEHHNFGVNAGKVWKLNIKSNKSVYSVPISFIISVRILDFVSVKTGIYACT